ncbi:MAG: tetratricopeptide repeat protein, partial [Hyphomicrobiales bacterium]|nr:tetratricopeptide repeat protein [Hyphomicrobiales bacterium]
MSVKIFLSAVSDEFRAYRDQLRGDFTRHNVEVKVQEDFKDLGGDTLDKLDVYIADCDAVVHLTGDMAGSEPPEPALRALQERHSDLADKLRPLGQALQTGAGVSYTQWEAWLALYHSKLLVIAKAAGSAERGPKYKPTGASRAAQVAHLRRLKEMGRYPGGAFTNPDNLAKSVLSSAILDLLVENVVVQRSSSGADTDIQPGRPYLRLTQYVRRTKLAARDNSEAALLSAYRSDVVPLIGRDRELGDLGRWLNDPRDVSVRVLVGAGGRGKTRLALELARTASMDGWLAGFASAEELDRFRSQGGVEQWRWDKPVFAIVDYAASRAEQLRTWLSELVDASLENRPKLRLLLLERQANRALGWFTTIFGIGDDDVSLAATGLLDPPEPVELTQLDELEFRRTIFTTLLTKGNTALAAPAHGADPEFDRLLGDRKWAGDPLYLMMAGLTAAKSGAREALSLSRADLALSAARKELDRIGKIGAGRGIDERHGHPGAFVRHMAVMATLAQGLELAAARTLAKSEREALGSAASLDATIAALADALPESGANGGVAPILPDIIGEGAVLAWFGPKGGLTASGLDPHESIAAAARVALAKVSASLVRTAQDFAPSGRIEPVKWLEALSGAPETDIGALMEIANALPDQTLALRELAVRLHGRIAAALRDAAAERPDAFLPNLATSLNHLGNRLSELGRREDALAAAEEATAIYRRLA